MHLKVKHCTRPTRVNGHRYLWRQRLPMIGGRGDLPAFPYRPSFFGLEAWRRNWGRGLEAKAVRVRFESVMTVLPTSMSSATIQAQTIRRSPGRAIDGGERRVQLRRHNIAPLRRIHERNQSALDS